MTDRTHPVHWSLWLILLLLLSACSQTTPSQTASRPRTPQPTVSRSTAASSLIGEAEHGDQTGRIPEGESALVSTLYEMLGHLQASAANLEQGNWALAQVHTAHPASDYWASIETALASRNLLTIREPLDRYLDAARSQAPDAHEKNQAAQDALRSAITTVSGSGDRAATIRAAALANLAEAIAAEFAEGVENGRLVNLEEYQDAWGFFQVLRAELPSVPDQAPTSASSTVSEVREVLEKLETSSLASFRLESDVAIPDSENVKQLLDHLATELRAAFRISAPEARTTTEQLEIIRTHLQNALSTYRDGNKDEAYEQAANAYLEGFEALEPPLLDAGKRELVERLELDFKAVRDAIREGRSVAEIEQLIEKVEAGLREVERILE